MNKTIQKLSLIAWAIIGAPAVFAVYVEWSYRYSDARGVLPYQILPRWLWFAVFGICLASGAVAIGSGHFKRKLIKIIIIFGYLVLSVILLAAISLYVSCINGDCL